jgi:hypothetical protein
MHDSSGSVVVKGSHQIQAKEPPAWAATLRAEMMPKPKHRQFSKNRRKALVKHILAWASALVTCLTLVKLIVELASMLH